MPEFTMTEYCDVRRRCDCSISSDRLRELRQESREAGENFDEFIDRVHEYIWEDPWDFIDDTEDVDEETNDRDIDFDELDDWLYGEYYDSFEETEEGKVCIGELR